jgi:hypothetical protein
LSPAITSLIVAVIGYVAASGLGAPDWLAQAVSVGLFFCTLPFALLFGSIGNAVDRSERKTRALERMARDGRGQQAPRPEYPVPRLTVKDDRVVIIDNRQVNIYNGEKAKGEIRYGKD